MTEGPASLVVLGFPKCGTSALMRELGSRDGVRTILAANGGLELAWPAIRSIETFEYLSQAEADGVRLILHKFTAYMYTATAIRYLAANPQRKLVICMRDPAKSLVSWWKMHRDIAQSGANINHFAYQERDFYANCTVEQYYEAYAKERLDYPRYIQRAVRLAGADRVFIISQERMSEDTPAAGDQIMQFALGEAEIQKAPPASASHLSYAEKAKLKLPDNIREELDQIYGATLVAAVRSGARALI